MSKAVSKGSKKAPFVSKDSTERFCWFGCRCFLLLLFFFGGGVCFVLFFLSVRWFLVAVVGFIPVDVVVVLVCKI